MADILLYTDVNFVTVMGLLYMFLYHKSLFPTAKLFVPLHIDVQVLFRYAGSNDIQCCLEVLVEYGPHLQDQM